MKKTIKSGMIYATINFAIFITFLYIGSTIQSTIGLFISIISFAFFCVALLVIAHTILHSDDKE